MSPKETVLSSLLFVTHSCMHACSLQCVTWAVTGGLSGAFISVPVFPLRDICTHTPPQLSWFQWACSSAVNEISIQCKSPSFLLFPFPSWHLLPCLPDSGVLEHNQAALLGRTGKQWLFSSSLFKNGQAWHLLQRKALLMDKKNNTAELYRLRALSHEKDGLSLYTSTKTIWEQQARARNKQYHQFP